MDKSLADTTLTEGHLEEIKETLGIQQVIRVMIVPKSPDVTLLHPIEKWPKPAGAIGWTPEKAMKGTDIWTDAPPGDSVAEHARESGGAGYSPQLDAIYVLEGHYHTFREVLHEIGHFKQQQENLETGKTSQTLVEFDNILRHENLDPLEVRLGYNARGGSGDEEIFEETCKELKAMGDNEETLVNNILKHLPAEDVEFQSQVLGNVMASVESVEASTEGEEAATGVLNEKIAIANAFLEAMKHTYAVPRVVLLPDYKYTSGSPEKEASYREYRKSFAKDRGKLGQELNKVLYSVQQIAVALRYKKPLLVIKRNFVKQYKAEKARAELIRKAAKEEAP